MAKERKMINSTFNTLDANLLAGTYFWTAFGRSFTAVVESAVAADCWVVRSDDSLVVLGRIERIGEGYLALARTYGVGLEASFASPFRAVAFALAGQSALPPLWDDSGNRADDPVQIRPRDQGRSPDKSCSTN